MARLPIVGGDNGNWGTILNDFLQVSLNSDGSIKQGAAATSSLSDVAVQSPANNQVLTYSNGKWVNQTPAGGVQLDTTSTDIQPVGVQTAGSTGKAADAGHIHPNEPWQFLVEAYGAKGDGKLGTGGTGSSGSPTFTDAGASFVAGDVGKVIVINQGATGGNTNPFSGKIAQVNSSTSVTLNANLGANASNAPYVYGTDDTAAINSCVLAAYNWFAANSAKVQVIFGDKIYMLGTFTQSTSYSWPSGLTGKYNCHIPLPTPSETGPKFQLELIGSGFSPAYEFWESLTPQLAGGTVLMSTGTTNAFQPDATYGQAYIIQSGQTGSTSGLSSWINSSVIMDGITLCMPWNSPTGGLDCLYTSQLGIPSGRVTAFAPINFNNTNTVGGPNLYNSHIVGNDSACGVQFPWFLNNAFNYVGYIICEGLGVGINVSEHFSAQYIGISYCDRGFQINGPSANPATHAITAQHMSIENCNHAIYVYNGNSAGFGNGTCPVFIGILDMESIFTDHINDGNNNLVGTVYWNNLTATHPVNVGAQNLIVINTTRVQPGPWSGAPAAPGNGTAQQNLAYRYATVYASATTSITNTATGQASTGLTNLGQTAGANSAIPIRVPPGYYFSVTYTGTLTTVWVLD